MDYAKESLKLHYEWQGKIEIKTRANSGVLLWVIFIITNGRKST